MTAWRPRNKTTDSDVCIPAIRGFDLDLRAVVTPEASLSLHGEDLLIGPAFGPILAVVNFVRAGRLAVRLSDRVVVAGDRLIARLRGQERLAVAELMA